MWGYSDYDSLILLLPESGSRTPDSKISGIGKALLGLQLKGNAEPAENSWIDPWEQRGSPAYVNFPLGFPLWTNRRLKKKKKRWESASV